MDKSKRKVRTNKKALNSNVGSFAITGQNRQKKRLQPAKFNSNEGFHS